MYTSALISLVICVIEGVLFSSWWVDSTTAKEFINIFTSASSGLFAIAIASTALFLNFLSIIASNNTSERKPAMDELREVIDAIIKGGGKLSFVGVGAFITFFSAILIHGFIALVNKSISIFILLIPQFALLFSLVLLSTAFVSASWKDKQTK